MEIKYCTGCKLDVPTSNYCKNKLESDGLNRYCKNCVKTYTTKRLKRNKLLKIANTYIPPIGFKICFTCKQELHIAYFNISNSKKDKLTPSCKVCINSRKIYKPMCEYSIKIIPELLAVEKWAPLFIQGEEFQYLISNCGRVKSLKKNIILKYSFDEDGYPQLTFYGNGKRITKKVHILVGLHFVENDDPINKDELNHEDGDKSNPYAYNLKWCTRKYNLKHRDETGLACKFTAYNHPRRKAVLKTSTGEVFASVKLAAIDAGIPHLYQHLQRGKGDYVYV